ATRQRARRHGLAAPVLGSGDDRQLAGPVGEELLQEIERLVDRFRVRVRTEVARRPIAELTGPEDPREILPEGDLDVGIGLVVLEPDVVQGPVMLDEVLLEEVGLGVADGEYVVEELSSIYVVRVVCM